MSFNSIDARLAWRLAPEVVFAPASLDFGQLDLNVKELREFYVSNLSGPIQRCAVICSDGTSWFRIVHVHPIDEESLKARLKMVVEVDTSSLAVGQRCEGWIEVQIEHIRARIPVRVATGSARPGLRTHTPWLQTFVLTVLAIVLVSGGLSLLSSTRAVALTSQYLADFTKLRSSPDRHLVSFSTWTGSELRLYTTAPATAAQQSLALAGWSPAWSPDGNKVAFLAQNSGVPQLYLKATGDQAALQVTHSDEPKSAPAWSADGRKVAFLAGPPAQGVLQLVRTPTLLWGSATPTLTTGRDGQIATVNALMRQGNGRAAVRGSVQRFAWSPHDNRLLFDYYQGQQAHILQIDEDGGIAEVAANSWSPTWSPTGDEIAAVSATGLFRLNLTDQTRYYLSRQPVHAPAWSPDGSRIAFLVDNEGEDHQFDQPPTARDLADGRQSRALWVIDATGDHEIVLAEVCLTFAWSPDGHRLAYITGGERTDGTSAAARGKLTPPSLYYLWTVVPGGPPILLAETNAPTIAWQPVP